MSLDQPSETWDWADVDTVLALLPTFEDPNFKPCEWESSRRLEDGSWSMPYPIYCAPVEELYSLIAKLWIHPYELLPEDPPEIELQRLVFTADYFATASVNQVRRYFALCKRRERFCDGYIEAEFIDGTVVAALHRMQTLRGDV